MYNLFIPTQTFFLKKSLLKDILLNTMFYKKIENESPKFSLLIKPLRNRIKYTELNTLKKSGITIVKK